MGVLTTVRVDTPLHDHLHQRQDKRLRTALVTLEDLRRDTPSRVCGTCSVNGPTRVYSVRARYPFR